MKLEYDREVDAAYIYIEYPFKDGCVKKTVELSESIVADFDDKGRLIGVEILAASKTLGKRALLEAEMAKELPASPKSL